MTNMQAVIDIRSQTWDFLPTESKAAPDIQYTEGVAYLLTQASSWQQRALLPMSVS